VRAEQCGTGPRPSRQECRRALSNLLRPSATRTRPTAAVRQVGPSLPIYATRSHRVVMAEGLRSAPPRPAPLGESRRPARCAPVLGAVARTRHAAATHVAGILRASAAVGARLAWRSRHVTGILRASAAVGARLAWPFGWAAAHATQIGDAAQSLAAGSDQAATDGDVVRGPCGVWPESSRLSGELHWRGLIKRCRENAKQPNGTELAASALDSDLRTES
jgi:hypothetical protein